MYRRPAKSTASMIFIIQINNYYYYYPVVESSRTYPWSWGYLSTSVHVLASCVKVREDYKDKVTAPNALLKTEVDGT